MKENPIQILLQNRTTSSLKGVYSCCSANEFVIRAAMRRGKATHTPVLVEATANQVNQQGGYTGMTPTDFRCFLNRIAAEESFPQEMLFCGGDHLGPLTWQSLPEAEAMENAVELVRSYVLAGFAKIHIDTSMRVADDDKAQRLSDEVIARRGAVLCRAAEDAFAEYQLSHPDACQPIYVIGSEVPIPGGARENEDSVAVTSPADYKATLQAFRSAFAALDLSDAWKRVVAVVVQPGVEFADESVVEYNPDAAADLMVALQGQSLPVFEGHSTDYQPQDCLRNMVADGIAILKVGPALTFALREGLFALEHIEQEVCRMTPFTLSAFRQTLEEVMVAEPANWKPYYHGDAEKQRYARGFSFSDRARYYLTDSRVQQAINQLLTNLDNHGIPLALLSQYLPRQYTRVRSGQLALRAADLLIDRVGDCIDEYLYAILPTA